MDRRGREERFSADIVVLSCSAIDSSALLLRSASDQHPNEEIAIDAFHHLVYAAATGLAYGFIDGRG